MIHVWQTSGKFGISALRREVSGKLGKIAIGRLGTLRCLVVVKPSPIVLHHFILNTALADIFENDLWLNYR